MMIKKHQSVQKDGHSEIFEEAVKRLGDLLKIEKTKSTKLADVYNHREQELKKEMAKQNQRYDLLQQAHDKLKNENE